MTNQLLFIIASDSGVRFINFFPLFLDSRQRLREEPTDDGLHLNRNGYKPWVDHLKKMELL